MIMRIRSVYQKLVKDNSRFFSSIQDRYPAFIPCSQGCSECCTLQSVFAIEAYFLACFWSRHQNISKKTERILPARETASSENCPFLLDQQCQVYPVRPIICRTHGLALATNDGSTLSWSSCPKAFEKGLPEDFEDE